MAISSFPFDNQDTTEDQYARLSAEFQRSGVAAAVGSSDLAPSATGGSLQVAIAAGSALVRGHMFISTAIEQVSIPVPATGTSVHRIVLRADPTANAVSLAVVQGNTAGDLPAIKDHPINNATGVYEMPLARVSISAGALNISPSNLIDDRPFLGETPAAWPSATGRPTRGRPGLMGYNAQEKRVEVYDGSGWSQLQANLPAGVVQMWAGGAIPTGWLLCDGAEVGAAAWPALASAVGNTYGSAAAGNFRLPNFTGRSPVGSGGNYAHGASGGSETKTLAVGHLPTHTHDIGHGHADSYSSIETAQHSHGYGTIAGSINVAGGGSNPVARYNVGDGLTGAQTANHQHITTTPAHAGASGPAGSGMAFDVINPWTAIKFIIKAV